VDYTTTATRQNNNQNQRTNLCKVITKKAIREFLPNTERGRDISNPSSRSSRRAERTPRASLSAAQPSSALLEIGG
jgi:hypothetical protein